MDSTKRYKSGEAPLHPDQRLSRETRAERTDRKRRHERLVNEHMYRAANSCAKKRRYATYDQARATLRFCEESEGGRSTSTSASTAAAGTLLTRLTSRNMGAPSVARLRSASLVRRPK